MVAGLSPAANILDILRDFVMIVRYINVHLIIIIIIIMYRIFEISVKNFEKLHEKVHNKNEQSY